VKYPCLLIKIISLNLSGRPYSSSLEASTKLADDPQSSSESHCEFKRFIPSLDPDWDRNQHGTYIADHINSGANIVSSILHQKIIDAAKTEC